MTAKGKGKGKMSRKRARALGDLERRLLRMREPRQSALVGRLERNISGQGLLAEMQTMLREEQKTLLAALRSMVDRG